MRKGPVKRNHFQEEEGLKWKWKTIKSLVHRLRLRFRQSLILSIMFAFKIAFFSHSSQNFMYLLIWWLFQISANEQIHIEQKETLYQNKSVALFFLRLGLRHDLNTVCASSLARNFRNVSFRTAKSNTNRTIEMQFIWNRTRSFPELNRLHENPEGRKKNPFRSQSNSKRRNKWASIPMPLIHLVASLIKQYPEAPVHISTVPFVHL